MKKVKKISKKDKAIVYIARELVFSKIGERISSVIEYSRRYNISVGLIQKAVIYLQNEGAVEFEKRGVLGSFVKNIDNEKLLEKSNFGSLIGVMSLPCSGKYERLSTGIKNNFKKYKINYHFAYMNGSTMRLDLLKKGNYEFAVVSKLAYELGRKKSDDEMYDIDSAYEFGKNSYVSRYVLLKAPGVKNITKIGIDRYSEAHKYLTKKCLKISNAEYVEIDYDETLELLKNNVIDAVIYNYDEINDRQIKLDYDELPENKLLDKACEALLVVNSKNYNLKRLSRKIIEIDYIKNI